MTTTEICSVCGGKFSPDELKEADDFDAHGNHRYLSLCEECVVDFGKLDITFNFKKNETNDDNI